MSIYLDYNASAPIAPAVLQVMVDVYQNRSGNAGSRTHSYGDEARAVVETARKQVASLLGISPAEVFFTSGATESSNIAIQGLAEYARRSGKRHIITSSIEHKAVLETVRAMERQGFDVDFVAPEPSGRVDAAKIVDKLRDTTLLVSLMHVNNETGIIQPVEELGAELAARDVLFHVDATQSCGKLVDELRTLAYHMLSFSAHKLRGPQGIGVLVLRKKGYRRPPVEAIMYGGQQERGLRPGTIPVALAAGCGAACALAEAHYAENAVCLKEMKERAMELLDASELSYAVNGDPGYCLPNTLNVCLHGVSSEALMIATKQYCAVSNGSACTSTDYTPSYVLAAMGLSAERIASSVRISWGADTDRERFSEEFAKLLTVARGLAQ